MPMNKYPIMNLALNVPLVAVNVSTLLSINLDHIIMIILVIDLQTIIIHNYIECLASPGSIYFLPRYIPHEALDHHLDHDLNLEHHHHHAQVLVQVHQEDWQQQQHLPSRHAARETIVIEIKLFSIFFYARSSQRKEDSKKLVSLTIRRPSNSALMIS